MKLVASLFKVYNSCYYSYVATAGDGWSYHLHQDLPNSLKSYFPEEQTKIYPRAKSVTIVWLLWLQCEIIYLFKMMETDKYTTYLTY